jgi:hypothetical protein
MAFEAVGGAPPDDHPFEREEMAQHYMTAQLLDDTQYVEDTPDPLLAADRLAPEGAAPRKAARPERGEGAAAAAPTRHRTPTDAELDKIAPDLVGCALPGRIAASRDRRLGA